MNRFELLEDAIGKIDDDLLLDAETVRNKKSRRPFVFFAVAACLTVMLLAIPLGILISNRSEAPSVPKVDGTSSEVVTTAKPPVTPRPSVLNIPGATPFDENDQKFQQLDIDKFEGSGGSALPDPVIRQWLEQVKEENTVVMGQVSDYTSVLVPDGDGYYRVTTMEIKVVQDISGVGKDTVKAVYACRYQPSGNGYIPETAYNMNNVDYTADMFGDYLIHTQLYSDDRSAGIFLLNDTNEKEVTIGETSYKLSNYSDTVMDACLLYRIGSGIAVLTGTSFANIDYHLIEEVFGVKEPETEKPKPAYDRDAIDMLNAPEPYKAITQNQNDTYFTVEKKNNRSSLVVCMLSESEFFDDLFIDKQTPNANYAWAVVIDDVVYDVESHLLVTSSAETLVHLDLGEDFDADEPFEQIILGIYNTNATPYSFDYFAILTQKN